MPPTQAGRTDEHARPQSSTVSEVIHRNPKVIGYTMAPAALPVLVVLRKYGLVAHTPIWLYVAVFVAIPVLSYVTDLITDGHEESAYINLRVALHVASVTIVIYMSGWGPEIVGAYGFVLVDNLARTRARTWRIVSFWTVVGVGFGQLAIWNGFAPTFLPVARANALALLGTFVVLFVARMLGATAEQKEHAEGALRSSEERFRALVQHSYDTMLITGEDGLITFASPAVETLIGRSPEAVVGTAATDYIHADEPKGSRLSSRLDSRTVR